MCPASVVNIKKPGTSIWFEDGEVLWENEAYQIRDTYRQIWDYRKSLVIRANGCGVGESEIERVNFPFGRFRLKEDLSPENVTVSAWYVPAGRDTIIARCKYYEMDTRGIAHKKSDLGRSRKGDRATRHDIGVIQTTLYLGDFSYRAPGLRGYLEKEKSLLIEVRPQSKDHIFRGWFRVNQDLENLDWQLDEIEFVQVEKLKYQGKFTSMAWDYL